MARIARGHLRLSSVSVTTDSTAATAISFRDFAGGVLTPSTTVNGGTYHFNSAPTSTGAFVPIYDEDDSAATLAISSTERRAYEIPKACYGASRLAITTTGTADVVDVNLKG